MSNKIEIIGQNIITSVTVADLIIGDSPHKRKMDQLTLGLVAASKVAIKRAGIKKLPQKSAIVIATQFGPMGSTKIFLEGIKRQGILQASPFIFPNTVIHMAAGINSLFFGVKGPVITLIGGYKDAVSLAKELIQNEKADVVIAGYIDDAKGILPRVKVKNSSRAVIVRRKRR